jgi:hypothetical protein
MPFLNPILLAAGLAAVSIPILIHLLMRQRRRPVMWGAMRFLMEAYRKHRRRLRLEQWLLLAARCLVIALVAFAIGRPLLGAAGLLGTRGSTTLYILIDNSLASTAVGGAVGGGMALERHREEAARALATLDAAAGDRAALIALGGPAEAVVLPPSPDLDAVASQLRRLEATDSAADLHGALERAAAHLEGQGEATRAVVLVLSDHLRGSAEVERALPSLAGMRGVSILTTRPGEGADNVSIVGVEPVRSILLSGETLEGAGDVSRQETVRVLLRRSGPGVGEAAVTPLRLRIQGRDATSPVAQGQVRWGAGQTEATAALAVSPPPGAGDAVIIAQTGDDAVAGDNRHLRPVQIRRSLNVGLITPRRGTGERGLDPQNPGHWLRIALSPLAADRQRWTAGEPPGDIQLTTIDPALIDAARLSAVDVAVVPFPGALSPDSWRRLRVLADRGGVVIVSPEPETGVHLWADAMLREFALDWTLPREASETEQTLATAQRGEAGSELLAMISAELGELARPVNVWRHLPIQLDAAGQGTEVLLTLSDGSPVLVAAPPGGSVGAESGRGLLVLFGVSPSVAWTDLPARPLFVPLVQELVRQGLGRARGSFAALAGTAPAAPARAVELLPDLGEGEAAAGGSIGVDESARAASPVRRAGVWRAVDRQGVTQGLVAVNADPRGGVTDPVAPEAVMSWLSATGAAVHWFEPERTAPAREVMQAAGGRAESGRLTLILLLAALGIAVAELAMARWFSHATVAPSGGSGEHP